MVLLLRFDAILSGLLIINGIIHRAYLLIVIVSFLVQLALSLARLLDLTLQFLAQIGDFSIHVLDFFIFALANE